MCSVAYEIKIVTFASIVGVRLQNATKLQISLIFLYVVSSVVLNLFVL